MAIAFYPYYYTPDGSWPAVLGSSSSQPQALLFADCDVPIGTHLTVGRALCPLPVALGSGRGTHGPLRAVLQLAVFCSTAPHEPQDKGLRSFNKCLSCAISPPFVENCTSRARHAEVDQRLSTETNQRMTRYRRRRCVAARHAELWTISMTPSISSLFLPSSLHQRLSNVCTPFAAKLCRLQGWHPLSEPSEDALLLPRSLPDTSSSPPLSPTIYVVTVVIAISLQSPYSMREAWTVSGKIRQYLNQYRRPTSSKTRP